MRIKNLYAPKLLEHHNPTNLETHNLIEKSGFMDYTYSGFYTMLPLGIKIMNKLERKIRELAEYEGFQEIRLPKLQPLKYLKDSGRLELFSREIIKLKDGMSNFCLCPTNEEVINVLLKGNLFHRHLPLTVYQFNEIFKNNTPATNLVSSREFNVFEAYSFHEDEVRAKEKIHSFQKIMDKLMNFTELNLFFLQTPDKEYGTYIKKINTGQHKFYLCPNEHSAFYEKEEVLCNDCNETMHLELGLSIAMYKIFDNSFAQITNNIMLDNNNKKIYPYLGTYGIGMSRLFYALFDAHRDMFGMNWPSNLAPFEFWVSPLHGWDDKQKHISNEIYDRLVKEGKNVLLDDREHTKIGSKLKTARLIGIPKMIIVRNREGTLKVEERQYVGKQKDTTLEQVLNN